MLVIEEVVGIDDVHARHLDVSLVFFFLMEGGLFEARLYARQSSGACIALKLIACTTTISLRFFFFSSSCPIS